MPSPMHQLLAWAVPRLRGAGALPDDDGAVEAERARIERWHAGLRPGLPTGAVPGLGRRFQVASSGAAGFTTYTLTPRDPWPTRTVLYLHGGGFVAGIDPFHVRHAARLATDLGARVVLPDYPLAPEHTWRDSHEALVDLAASWIERSPDGVVVAGDSAGGGIALSVAQTLRDQARQGAAQPSHLLLVSPWVDLSPGALDGDGHGHGHGHIDDPWLDAGKLAAYGSWWAGSPDDATRPEVSPGLGDLDGLPPTLLLTGTRDLLWPGCVRLAERAAAADWRLTYVEEPGLVHVYPLLPGLPEAARARRTTLRFLAQAGGPS